MTNNQSGLREDEFVFHLVKDPANPPDTLLLYVFVGKSASPGCIRLYVDPLLTAYVDIPADAVLHAEPLPKAQSPLGGYSVWIRREPDYIRSVREAYERSAQVLQELTTGATASAPPVFSSMPAGWPGTFTQS